MNWASNQKLVALAVSVIPILFAITVHEVAHGWVAYKLGDNTAKDMGRLSFNPIKHIDLIGTILVPFILYLVSGFMFGWAKPVPVNFKAFKKPRRDIALVSFAGPASNIIMAILWGIVAKLSIYLQGSMPEFSLFLVGMGITGLGVNVIFAVLNLIPIPPLDGSRIVSCLLPRRYAYQYNRLERFGFIILVLLMVSGLLGRILMPFAHWMLSLIMAILGIF